MRRVKAAGPAAGIRALAIILTALFVAGCPLTQNMPQVVKFTDPLTSEEHAQLGAMYEQQGNVERAVSEYAAALKKDPENLVALTGLGNVSLNQKKPRLAAKYYKRALEQEPDNMVVLNNLAMAWITAGKPQKALPYADRAVAIDGGKDPRMLDTRAQARLAAGDRDGALTDLGQAVALCALYGNSAQLNGPCTEIKGRYAQLSSER
jgi:Tfp pilus assembly protein PilF